MNLLINLLFAVVAYLLSAWLLGQTELSHTLVVLLSLVVAIVVFLQDFAAKVKA